MASRAAAAWEAALRAAGARRAGAKLRAAALLALAAAAPADAAWFDAAWRSRRAVSVSNPGGALSRYSVPITFDSSALIAGGRMRSDCADIRIVDSDRITPLDYWLESGCNGASTVVWAEAPSLPAGGKTLYLYYGNASASSTSDPETVFGFDAADVGATYGYHKHVSTFSLLENRVSATNLAASDDSCSSVQNLGFDARFYGTSVTTLTASSNGLAFLAPTNCATAYINSASTFITYKTIGFWDDLFPRAGGVVATPGTFVDALTNKARVTWEATHISNTTYSIIFQVLLFSSGKAVFSIGDGTNLANFTPTVGISRGDGVNFIDITSEVALNTSWVFYLRKTASPEPVARLRPRDLSLVLPQ